MYIIQMDSYELKLQLMIGLQKKILRFSFSVNNL